MSEPSPERSIFLHAIGLGSAEERGAYLDEACRDNPHLRPEVEALLTAHDRLGGGPPAPPSGPSAPGGSDTAPASPGAAGEATGTVISHYKLLEQIGEGGMGTVWLAEQAQPIRRRVALKLIKPGMDSRQVLARFDAERQALALMDHPNIAKVLDAGAAPDGRPYFVMELVKGVPITRYCDEHHLTPRQRLELFVPVCQAIQHAHQKGVIHRDLKPSNILVALYDDKPVPKIIDFGVAKAAGQPLTEQTLHTGYGAVVGTVEYMSPEQASFNNLDIDTRSDIYSLGVVLYELLAGSPPFSRKELEKAGLLETLRTIREQEPTKPSAKLSTAAGLPTLAANRGTEPAKLRKLVRGELDWIVMKALEKDRTRRYETANSFAMDVQRYLADEPVQACPPSTWYRFRKFARRNKGGMVTASVIALAVLLAVGSLTVSYLQSQSSLRQEKQAKDDLVQTLYYQWVAAAADARDKNRPALAEELLEKCPPHLRGWEWHYVKRLPFAGVMKLHHDDIVHRVVWSPDGRLLASASLKGWAKVWNAETGEMLVHLFAHKKYLRCLAFSPNGQLLATGGEDDTVKLWDITQPGITKPDRLVREFPTGPRTTMVLALEFSPDGRFLAAADHDRIVRCWDLTSHAEVRLPDDLLVCWGLAFTPDGRHLVTVNTEGVVKRWDIASRELVAELHTDSRAVGYRVAFSRDQRFLAIGCEDGTIKIVRTDPLEVVRTLEAHTGEIAGLAFGADERLASAGNDMIVKVWDLRTGQEALALDSISRRANGLAFSPDGHTLAVGSADGFVRILNGTPLDGPGDAGQLLTLEGHDNAVVGLAYSPDSRRIVSASRDGTAKVWDAHTGHELLTLAKHEAALTGVAWQPGGRRVVTASWDGTARVWDPVTGEEVLALHAGAGPVYGIAFNGNGSLLATAHHDGSLRVWDAETGRQQVCITRAHDHPVLGLAFSPDGERLVSAGGGDNYVKVWDWKAEPKKPERTFTALGILQNPVFRPDGQRLVAVINTPAQVCRWDMGSTTTEGQVQKGQEQLLRDTWRVSQAIVRPGERLAVVSSSRIQFLEADGAEGPALVGGHAGEIGCAAFSPDGKHMATGAGYKGYGEVRIWDATRWETKP
jgi:eukaryotic-like serine/threonine-protein kinase